MLVQQFFYFGEFFVDGTSTTLKFWAKPKNFFHFLPFLWLYLCASYCMEKDTYIRSSTSTTFQNCFSQFLSFFFRLHTFANTHSLVSLMISWITSLPIISTAIALDDALEWWSILLLLLCWMFTFENAFFTKHLGIV